MGSTLPRTPPSRCLPMQHRSDVTYAGLTFDANDYINGPFRIVIPSGTGRRYHRSRPTEYGDCGRDRLAGQSHGTARSSGPSA